MLHQALEDDDAERLIVLKIDKAGGVSLDFCDNVEVQDISYAAHFLTHFVMNLIAGGNEDE